MSTRDPRSVRETPDPATAAQFISELLDACGSLNEIADRHGSRTLADVLYLHHAILTEGYIQWFRDDSRINELVAGLPSADRWKAYIDTELRSVPETCVAPQPSRSVAP